MGSRHDLVLPWDQRIGDYRISPDGYIAFTSDVDGDEKWSLYLYTGDKLTLISGGDGSINLLGSWSPDGKMLAYTSNKANNVDFDLYVYDTLSGQSKRVAEGVGMNFAEAWVDGRILVVRRNTNLDSDILLVDPKTGREELLTPHEGEAVNRNPTPLEGAGWHSLATREASSRASAWSTLGLGSIEAYTSPAGTWST